MNAQAEVVYDYMREFGSITSMEGASRLGVMDTRKRISELRREGVEIVDEWVTRKNRYGKNSTFKVYKLKAID